MCNLWYTVVRKVRDMWTIVLIGIMLGMLEFTVTRKNFGVLWNGFGALVGSYRRTGGAPMRYRVLFPYLLVPLFKRTKSAQMQNAIYQAAKTAFLVLSLVLMYNGYGLVSALTLAVLVAATFQFDYWDCYVELAAIIGLLTLAPAPALLLFVLLALARPEVVPFALPMYVIACVTRWEANWLVAFASVIPVFLVKAVETWQGVAPLYCPRLEVLNNNPKDVLAIWKQLDAHIVISAGLVVFGLLALLKSPPIEMAIIPLFWIPSGVIFGRVTEPRVFMPLAILIAWGIS